MALLPACSLPRDPNGTLSRVQKGVLRVGIAIHPPWTTDSAGTYGGVEPALVKTLAQELGASIEWTAGGESVLLPRLHAGDLDIVVAGLDATTPWSKSVGVTRPYFTVANPDKRELVWAVAPGENEFHMRIDHFLRAQRPRVEAMRPALVRARAE